MWKGGISALAYLAMNAIRMAMLSKFSAKYVAKRTLIHALERQRILMNRIFL